MKTKRIVSGIAAAVLVFSLETMSVFAAGGRNFVDVDNDGICDYCGTDCQFVDADGDGICDNYNNRGTYGNGAGLGYVDADGDCVCDNYVSGGRGYCGNGGGRGGRGRCRR